MATNLNPLITTPTRSLPKLNWKRGFIRLAVVLYLPLTLPLVFALDAHDSVSWILAPVLSAVAYAVIVAVVLATRWVARGFKGQP